MFSNYENPKEVIRYISQKLPEEQTWEFLNDYWQTPDYKNLLKIPVEKMNDDQLICLAVTRKHKLNDAFWAKFKETSNPENGRWFAYDSDTQKHLDLILLSSCINSAMTEKERKHFFKNLLIYPNNKFLNFSFSTLREIDLSNMKLKHIDLQSANLDHANLMATDLDEACLKRGSFVNAKFINASLKDADLSSGLFCKANFRGANLSGANLVSANFAEADLKDTVFIPLLDELLKNFKCVNDDLFFETLISQVDELEEQTTFLLGGLHEVRKAIAQNIVSIVQNYIQEPQTKLEILDKLIQHPIFAHRSDLARNMNSIFSYFSTYQVPTHSQGILIKVKEEIDNKLVSNISPRASNG